jgi:hypothetical protein
MMAVIDFDSKCGGTFVTNPSRYLFTRVNVGVLWAEHFYNFFYNDFPGGGTYRISQMIST